MQTIITGGNCAKKAALVLRNGGIMIYPTETVYGIGADATNRKALARVARLKQRPADKKFIVAFSGISMAKKYMELSPKAILLAKKFMPGPLTLVVPNRKLSNFGKHVAFRIPASRIALSIIRSLGKPITSTSANISGREPLCSMDEIMAAFRGKVDLIVDAGSMPKRKPSAVFDAESGKLLREGAIGLEDIRKAGFQLDL